MYIIQKCSKIPNVTGESLSNEGEKVIKLRVDIRSVIFNKMKQVFITSGCWWTLSPKINIIGLTDITYSN